MAKKTNKYLVDRRSVGVRLMWGGEAIILHNGVKQSKLKELFEAGFTNAIIKQDGSINDSSTSAGNSQS